MSVDARLADIIQATFALVAPVVAYRYVRKVLEPSQSFGRLVLPYTAGGLFRRWR